MGAPSDSAMRPILALLLCLLAFPLRATMERQALVIGNAAYQDESPLVNTLNDAEDIAAKLRNLGFEVTLKENLDVRAMRRTVNRFLGKVERRSGIALLYFSGHGVQDANRSNYLLPVDARIDTRYDIPADGVAVNDIMESLGRRPNGAVSLVVLDACRNNPFSEGLRSVGKGLAQIGAPPGGSLVLYAASPGQTASDNPGRRNGLFTEQLLAVLDRPGLDIEDAFEEAAIAVKRASGNRQVPYKEGNLLGKHYLSGPEVRTPAAHPPARTSGDHDLIAWQSARDCATSACYRAYLKGQPEGRFRHMAEAMIAALQRPATPPPLSSPAVAPAQSERLLGLSRDQRRNVQRWLNVLGYDAGGADGLFGNRTRRAIEGLQTARDEAPTGYLTPDLYAHLQTEGDRRQLERDRRSMSAEVRELLDKALAGEAQAQTRLGYAYDQGEGVRQDDAKAVKWYRKAAEQGHALGQNNLGVMYRNGEGVRRDHAEAVKWYRKAAEQGHALGQSNLGGMYRNGEGVRRDYAEAVNWYRKAAEQENAIAQYNLGQSYRVGKGVRKDRAEAAKWYRKAAAGGVKDARKRLKEMGR